MNSNRLSVWRKLHVVIVLVAAALASGACAVLDAGPPPVLEANARWAVLPFANHTETPLAGSRAAAIAAALLQSRGLADVRSAPGAQQEGLADPVEHGDPVAALEWARKEGARYAVGGSVDEWRYKVGVDGEPAVSLALQIIDVRDGRVLWSGVSGSSGWSRESLGGLAQKVLRELLSQAMH
jgi:TolB-like protein